MAKTKTRYDDEGRSPPVKDPVWVKWSAPILEFLTEPRTWADLHGWRSQTGMGEGLFRNCIAWLENSAKAFSFKRGGITYWAPMTLRAEFDDDPVPDDTVEEKDDYED